MTGARYSWDDLIPADETRSAVEFLVGIWNRASISNPDKFKYSQGEPKLTERLTIYLSRHQADSGLTGWWVNEPQEPMEDEAGDIIRIRKDICYLSNRSEGKRLNLVFEFKKLSQGSYSNYQGESGIKRFVTGDYSKGEPLAFMVAIVRPGNTEAVEGLYRSLMKPAKRRMLQMVQDSKGKYVLRPSEFLPHIIDFETKHNRPPSKAPRNGTITLGHIFLYAPV